MILEHITEVGLVALLASFQVGPSAPSTSTAAAALEPPRRLEPLEAELLRAGRALEADLDRCENERWGCERKLRARSAAVGALTPSPPPPPRAGPTWGLAVILAGAAGALGILVGVLLAPH